MSYRVRVDSAAEKKLRRLDRQLIPVVLERIYALAGNPRPPGCKQLTETRHGGWRVRVGKHRILYRIDDAAHEVAVYDIDLRDRVYRRKRR